MYYWEENICKQRFCWQYTLINYPGIRGCNGCSIADYADLPHGMDLGTETIPFLPQHQRAMWDSTTKFRPSSIFLSTNHRTANPLKFPVLSLVEIRCTVVRWYAPVVGKELRWSRLQTPERTNTIQWDQSWSSLVAPSMFSMITTLEEVMTNMKGPQF